MTNPVERLSVPRGLVSPETLGRLRSLLEEPIRGALLVLVGPPDVAFGAATALAAALVSTEAARAVDVRLAVPEGDRWTIAELDSQVIGAASYVAMERTVVVVAGADQMDASASEHLLKTVEEPPGGALFLFCVSDPDRLLPTIRGRASALVPLQPAPPAERAAALHAAGLDPDVAEELVTLAGHHVSLLSAASELKEAERSELVEDLRSFFSAPLETKTPTAAAEDLVARAERLACFATGSTKRTKTLTPQAKAQVRSLVRSRLTRWEGVLSEQLRSADTPEAYARVTSSLAALDQAELELRSYAPPFHVLAATLSRCT